MQKSSRHSKITGNFGEALTLYWLSKRGFECADVDHTGIDLIARRPLSEEVLGISVNCRSRSEGTEALESTCCTRMMRRSRAHVARFTVSHTSRSLSIRETVFVAT
jgi:Holliday junction resolvase-like predicted endonuclease